MAGQGNRFLADALHEATVAGDHIGAVIDQVVAPTGGQRSFGQGHADGVGEALAKRTGSSLNAAGDAVFRVAGSPRAELAKLLQLIQRKHIYGVPAA